MDSQLELQFVECKIKFFLGAYLKLAEEGKSRILLRPFNQLAFDFLMKAAQFNRGSVFYADEAEAEIPLPPNVSPRKGDELVDAVILFASDAKLLSAVLMDYVDVEKGIIVAPITERYYKNKPLFLISIPKSGTHLLYELAQAFGYNPGIICPDNPSPGFWYCVEYSNSHTSARDFFIDTVRRSPFGNRHHAFIKSPAIFIYRNPLDIVVSEANYYHKDGKTVFYSYFSNLTFEERLLRLMDDPWLLGGIRERIGNFIAWLDFQNVIPISFEELIGPNGGGDLDVQTKLIWSLQLKLHVPGSPRRFGDSIFNKDSATFHEGRIGAYRKYFSARAYEKFYALPQDFMVMLGYDFDDKDNPRKIPERAHEFRKRPIVFAEVTSDNIPIAFDLHYLGHSIVRYRNLFYAIPHGVGAVDLSKVSNRQLKKLHSSGDINSLKRKLFLGGGISGSLLVRRYFHKLGRLCSKIFALSAGILRNT